MVEDGRLVRGAKTNYQHSLKGPFTTIRIMLGSVGGLRADTGAGRRKGQSQQIPGPLVLVAIFAVNVLLFVLFRVFNPNVSFGWRTESNSHTDMNKLHSEHVRASMQADWAARCKQDKQFFSVNQGRLSLKESYVRKLTKQCDGKSSGLVVRLACCSNSSMRESCAWEWRRRRRRTWDMRLSKSLTPGPALVQQCLGA